MATYQEQIAAWRAQRQQQQVNDRLQQIRSEHAQAVRERDVAIPENRMEDAELRDMDCQQLEQEWHQYNPPRQQADPRMVEFVRRRQPFVDRHGQAAYQAMDMAHRYATAPRDPNATAASVGAGRSGMGLTPNTPAYFQAMDSLLTMYAKDYGLHYDPEEKLLTANQAAKISGLSPQQYNHAAQQIGSQGRYSWQQKQGK